MAKFLNTDKLNEWIPRLIESSEKELIIIVPYIQTSDRIYKSLLEANKRGVETTLIYRENKLNDKEKAKLYSLDNLNLMHHPNVHAKCYYNQHYLIIGSMNLYEYSEKNNREMGILLHKIGLGDESGSRHNTDDEVIFKDAVDEIRIIINASTSEKQSIETKTEGFEMAIIKTDKEKQEELCKKLNKVFAHKKFEPLVIGNIWVSACKNYFDKIDVAYTHRLELNLTMESSRIETIYKNFRSSFREYLFDGFKLYWNNEKDPIYLGLAWKLWNVDIFALAA